VTKRTNLNRHFSNRESNCSNNASDGTARGGAGSRSGGVERVEIRFGLPEWPPTAEITGGKPRVREFNAISARDIRPRRRSSRGRAELTPGGSAPPRAPAKMYEVPGIYPGYFEIYRSRLPSCRTLLLARPRRCPLTVNPPLPGDASVARLLDESGYLLTKSLAIPGNARQTTPFPRSLSPFV